MKNSQPGFRSSQETSRPEGENSRLDHTSVLVLAHVFPRALDDSMGAFLLHLAGALAASGIHPGVVAPHAAGLLDKETLGAAQVHRFHYAPAGSERLAYTGTMHELVARGIGSKVLFGFFNLAFLIKTLRVIRSSRPALVHAHWWLPDGLIGALASLLARRPLVITTHGTDVEMLRKTGWTRSLARFVFGRARAVTCGSTYMRDQLLALGVVDAARVSVVPMPVSAVFEQVEGYAIKPSFDVLTVARLTAQKSVDTLIEAMAVLRDRNCTARLGIVGDGPERGRLEYKVRELALQEQVTFVGALPQEKLPPYYAGCSIFVLPSIREGMGLVLAEALLCGAPVIACNSGGVTDIVKAGETGLLVPEREPAALAGAIQTLLNDRGLAARLSANGRAWVQARYTSEQVAKQFVHVYTECLS